MDGERTDLSRRALLGAATAGIVSLAGCQGVEENLRLPVDTSCKAWLRGVETYDEKKGLKDMRGKQTVTVKNGTGPNGWYFDPPAIRVDSGTKVVWEWTADTARHNIKEVDGLFKSELTDSDTKTFSYTFDNPGTYRYLCTPHDALKHRGVVVVGQSGCQSLYGGGSGQGPRPPNQNGTQSNSSGGGSGQTAGSSSTQGGGQGQSSSRLVVKPADTASQQDITAAKQTVGGQVVDTVPESGVQFWTFDASMTVDQAVQRLNSDPAIAWARPDYSSQNSGGNSGQNY